MAQFWTNHVTSNGYCTENKCWVRSPLIPERCMRLCTMHGLPSQESVYPCEHRSWDTHRQLYLRERRSTSATWLRCAFWTRTNVRHDHLLQHLSSGTSLVSNFWANSKHLPYERLWAVRSSFELEAYISLLCDFCFTSFLKGTLAQKKWLDRHIEWGCYSSSHFRTVIGCLGATDEATASMPLQWHALGTCTKKPGLRDGRTWD